MINGYVNDKTGKPLGFMNPLLYQMAATQPSTFTDITKGNNKCTENGCSSSCKGFEATKGWDPVTGLVCFPSLCYKSYFNSLSHCRAPPSLARSSPTLRRPLSMLTSIKLESELVRLVVSRRINHSLGLAPQFFALYLYPLEVE